eukprot:4412334-Prymnesium_polylepis.1
MVNNQRITECIKMSDDDTVGSWYGGLVVAVTPGNACLIAYGDGDMDDCPIEKVRGLLEMGKLKVLQDERGLVKDEWQAAKAMAASLLKVGGGLRPSRCPSGRGWPGSLQRDYLLRPPSISPNLG